MDKPMDFTMSAPLRSRLSSESRVSSETETPAAKALEDEVVALFDQLRRPLLRYLLAIGLRIQDAEEIAQEVFLALFEHLRAGKSRASLNAWVFRVGHNLGLKRLMASRRQVDSEAELVDRAPSPEDHAVSGQQRTRLLAVVQALPEVDRRCLYLRSEGLRYREIAEILDVSVGAVSNSLSRSLARIARAGGK
jgi:RNA polymerase sigma-70 factor (ECF subfamily)